MRTRQRLTLLSSTVLLATGCVKDISSEDRLERATMAAPVSDAPGAAELDKVSCEDITAELAKARDVNRPEADRVGDYTTLYETLSRKTRVFEEAMSRNPDLQYREGSEKYAAAHERCVQQTADVRVEFERFVRELVEVPTVQEVKGGTTMVVARLDFDTLREGVESLKLDDEEALLARVEQAEKKISAPIEKKPPRKRRRR